MNFAGVYKRENSKGNLKPNEWILAYFYISIEKQQLCDNKAAVFLVK